MKKDHIRFPLLALPVLVTMTASALAAPELVTNGNFGQTTLATSTQFSGTTLTGWTNATTSGTTGYGYNFLTLPGTADSSGFTTLSGTRNRLDGPGGNILTFNYSNNGLPASSPDGGNYLISSTDTTNGGAVSQSIGGLTIGQTYTLSFYWAAAQFASTLVATTEYWAVTFGGITQSTAVSSQSVGGFTPWTKQTMTFTANSITQVLSFLAVGTPGGVPSAGLLDGVSLTAVAVPEPGSWALVLTGLLGTAWLARRRARVLVTDRRRMV